MNEKKPQKQLRQFVMLSLLSAASVLVMANESVAALQCYSCHGQTSTAGNDIRPLDTPAGSLSSYRNISSGAVKGSHQKHVAQTTDATQCTVCHNNGTTYTSNHRTGVININSGVAYNKGAGAITFTNQTTVPVLGSCATASCHVAATDQVKVTPAWGETATCSSCHDATPTTGKHTKHLTTAYHAVSCADCHTGASTTSGGANHLDAAKVINVAAGLGYPTTTAKHASTSGYVGSCATSYCHSSGQSEFGDSTTPVYPAVAPTWGGTAACGSCHATTALATGSHLTHISKYGTCASCHTGATATTYDATTHVDKNIDVAAAVGYTSNGTPGNGWGSCNTASCHSAFTNTAALVIPAWGNYVDCNSCHAQTPTTGAHSKHTATCSTCHTSSGAPSHADGTVNFVAGMMPAPYAGGVAKHAAGSYVATCTTSCHNAYGTTAAPTPNWGSSAGCSSCHNTPPTTGLHAKHKATTDASCNDCHTGATLTNKGASHGNGYVDVTQGYPANVVKHASGSGYGTCSAASCHDVYGTGSTAILTPNWGVNPATTACTSCHTATITTGKHTDHLTTTSRVITCADCHAGASATSGGTSHINGMVNISTAGVAKKELAKHATGSGYTTCTTSCHNAPGATPVFTAPALSWASTTTPVRCDSCHGYPPANTNHASGSGYVASGSCSGCHSEVNSGGTVTASTFATPAMHINGKVDGGKCNSCHGYPPVQTMTNAANAALGVTGNYTGAKLQNYSGGGGVHAVAGHLPLTVRPEDKFGVAGSGCLTCHPSTSHPGGTTFLTANVQIVVDTQFKFDKNRPIVYNAVQSGTSKKSGTCANVSCHFQKSPLWSTETYTKAH